MLLSERTVCTCPPSLAAQALFPSQTEVLGLSRHLLTRVGDLEQVEPVKPHTDLGSPVLKAWRVRIRRPQRPLKPPVERFNGRVQREVLGITTYGHSNLEKLLKGFNRAYTMRQQRVLKDASPEQIVQQAWLPSPITVIVNCHLPSLTLQT
jgi:hypothetical protein